MVSPNLILITREVYNLQPRKIAFKIHRVYTQEGIEDSKSKNLSEIEVEKEEGKGIKKS